MSDIPPEVAAVISPAEEQANAERQLLGDGQPVAATAPAAPALTGRDKTVLALQRQVAHLVELATGLESDNRAGGFDPHHQLGRIVRMGMAADEALGLTKKLRVQFGALCIDFEREARTPAVAPDGESK
jgi:hypothetical protein